MITYHCDYRSPPSGLGTITLENGDMILLQSNDEANEVKEGIYSKVIVLNNIFDDFEELHEETIKILKSYNVTHVYDSEAEDTQFDSQGYSYMTLDQFSNSRF